MDYSKHFSLTFVRFPHLCMCPHKIYSHKRTKQYLRGKKEWQNTNKIWWHEHNISTVNHGQESDKVGLLLMIMPFISVLGIPAIKTMLAKPDTWLSYWASRTTGEGYWVHSQTMVIFLLLLA